MSTLFARLIDMALAASGDAPVLAVIAEPPASNVPGQKTAISSFSQNVPAGGR